MRVKVDEEEFTVEFRYYWVRLDGTRVRNQIIFPEFHREATQCVIAHVVEGREMAWFSAKVVRFWKDKPNRRDARERALDKAIEKMAADLGLALPSLNARDVAAYKEKMQTAFHEWYCCQCRPSVPGLWQFGEARGL